MNLHLLMIEAMASKTSINIINMYHIFLFISASYLTISQNIFIYWFLGGFLKTDTFFMNNNNHT